MGKALPAVLEGVLAGFFFLFLLLIISFFLQVIVALRKFHAADEYG